MTIFDIEENEGVWFEMEGGGRVKIKTLTFDDWKRINKESEVKLEPVIKKVDGKHQLFERKVHDEMLQSSLVNDACIVAWENILDKNGNQIPCTLENKNKLLTLKDPSFRNFVDEKMGILNAVKAEEKEAEEKN